MEISAQFSVKVAGVYYIYYSHISTIFVHFIIPLPYLPFLCAWLFRDTCIAHSSDSAVSSDSAFLFQVSSRPGFLLRLTPAASPALQWGLKIS